MNFSCRAPDDCAAENVTVVRSLAIEKRPFAPHAGQVARKFLVTKVLGLCNVEGIRWR